MKGLTVHLAGLRPHRHGNREGVAAMKESEKDRSSMKLKARFAHLNIILVALLLLAGSSLLLTGCGGTGGGSGDGAPDHSSHQHSH